MKPAGQVTVWKQENEAAVGNGVDAVVNFFASVAAEEGWQPDGELDAYRSRSTYFALTGDDGTVAGGLQLIAPCPERTLPCVKVWPELVDTFKASQETITHVALLAVAKEWRGRKPGSGGLAPFWQLTAAMWNHCVRYNITELWIEATPATLRAYRMVGWPLQVRGELRNHWGEPCYPCSLSIAQVGGALAVRAVRSPTYRCVLTNMVGGVPGDYEKK